jgi:hypothetical protein
MTVKQLTERESDGVRVEILAMFDENTFNGKTELVAIDCHVSDSRNGSDFTIRDIPRDRVLEVFNHPFSVGRSLLMRGSL